MLRWVVPVGAAAILIALAALVIILVTNSGGGAGIEAGQVEEPEVSPQPTQPEPGEGGLDGGGLTVQEGQDDQEDPVAQEEPTVEEPTEETGPIPTLDRPSIAVIEFTGNSSYYCSAGAIGEPETIQGQGPATYEVVVATGGTSLDTVMASCQKISPGTLGVSILYEDEVVAQEETDVRLGTVSVAWNPLQGSE